MSKEMEKYCSEVEKLTKQLKLADTWEFIKFYEILQKTGAWSVLDNELLVGWVPMLEAVYMAAVEAEKTFKN